MLGLGFEHRSPASPITLDEAKTIRYFQIKHWILADSGNWPIPYKNEEIQSQQIQLQNPNYFQQLFENTFGYHSYLQ